MGVAKAVARINNEITEKNNSYVRTVGNFLKEYLEIDPAAAEKILVKEKTITKSIGEMRKEANKNKIDGVGVLSDEEGFEIVLKYYDIDPVDPNEKAEDSFDVELDDFL